MFPPGKFEGYRVDGELRRGPGVLDMKGGLVVIAWALQGARTRRGGLEPLPPLRDRGRRRRGGRLARGRRASSARRSRAAPARWCSSRAAQGDAIITRRKGTGALNATAHGKAAHAGNAHAEGKNAIWALARFIDRAQALTDYDQGVTVNVGKISGGQGKNTVPDHAEAQVDLRFCTKKDADALVAGFRRAAERGRGLGAGHADRALRRRRPRSAREERAERRADERLRGAREGLRAAAAPRRR